MEEKVNDALLAFIDFLYAVVFGLVLAEVYTEILEDTKLTLLDKAGSILLMISVFYFLAWDWLHGRLLTLRNPFTSYRRFFLEAVIAFVSYGAAVSALKRDPSFLVYIALILVLGAYWSYHTKKEHPDSNDAWELTVISRFQPIFALASALTVLVRWYFRGNTPIKLAEISVTIGIGWLFVLFYEIFVNRQLRGVIGGPGVPFMSRQRLDETREYLS